MCELNHSSCIDVPEHQHDVVAAAVLCIASSAVLHAMQGLSYQVHSRMHADALPSAPHSYKLCCGCLLFDVVGRRHKLR
jgi:hypothetical protein